MPYKDLAARRQYNKEYQRTHNTEHNARCVVYMRIHGPKVRDAERLKRHQRQQMINDIKLSRGCLDCGYKDHPAALEFDHVRGEKHFIVSHGVQVKGLATILAEIAKCDVVCANCHAVRTANRRLHGRG